MRQTSQQIMQLASKVLSDHNSSEVDKQLATSLISMSGSDKHSSRQIAMLASQVMRGQEYSAQSKSLAASLLAQARRR